MAILSRYYLANTNDDELAWRYLLRIPTTPKEMKTMNITVSRTVWAIAHRFNLSSRSALGLTFAAIVILVAGGLTSCGNMAPIRVGYRGASLQIGGGQGGRPFAQRPMPMYDQQQTSGQTYSDYNGGQYGGQPYGGEQSSLGNSGLTPVSGQQIDVQLGQMVSNQCFGGQPVTPTAGCIRLAWVEAFGPETIWVNDFGRGRAQMQRVPQGEIVFFDPVTKQAWRINCHNRVRPIPVRHRQVVIQRPPIVMQGPVQNYGYQGWCPPPAPICRPAPMVCRQPQPRLMYVPNNCPPPRQQVNRCNPGYNGGQHGDGGWWR